MPSQHEINCLQAAYLTKQAMALGARLMRLELVGHTEVSGFPVGLAFQQRLEKEAAEAMAAWKTAVGCTPEFEAAYQAQLHTTRHLQAVA